MFTPNDIKQKVADKLISDIDNNIDKIKKVKDNTSSQLTNVKNTISSSAGSLKPLNEVKTQMSTVLANQSTLLPKPNTPEIFGSLQGLIDVCGYLKNHGSLSDPSNLFRGISGSLGSSFRDVLFNQISDLIGGGAEFNIGFNLSRLGISLGGIPNLVSNFDGILNCLDILGVDPGILDDKIGDLDGLLGDMNLDINGKIDKEGIVISAGIGDKRKVAGILIASDTVEKTSSDADREKTATEEDIRTRTTQQKSSGDPERQHPLYRNLDLDNIQYITKDTWLEGHDFNFEFLDSLFKAYCPKGTTDRIGFLPIKVKIIDPEVWEIDSTGCTAWEIDSTSYCTVNYVLTAEVSIGKVKKSIREALWLECKEALKISCGTFESIGYLFDQLDEPDQIRCAMNMRNVLSNAIQKVLQDFTFEDLNDQLFLGV